MSSLDFIRFIKQFSFVEIPSLSLSVAFCMRKDIQTVLFECESCAILDATIFLDKKRFLPYKLTEERKKMKLIQRDIFSQFLHYDMVSTQMIVGFYVSYQPLKKEDDPD